MKIYENCTSCFHIMCCILTVDECSPQRILKQIPLKLIFYPESSWETYKLQCEYFSEAFLKKQIQIYCAAKLFQSIFVYLNISIIYMCCYQNFYLKITILSKHNPVPSISVKFYISFTGNINSELLKASFFISF